RRSGHASVGRRPTRIRGVTIGVRVAAAVADGRGGGSARIGDGRPRTGRDVDAGRAVGARGVDDGAASVRDVERTTARMPGPPLGGVVGLGIAALALKAGVVVALSVVRAGAVAALATASVERSARVVDRAGRRAGGGGAARAVGPTDAPRSAVAFDHDAAAVV